MAKPTTTNNPNLAGQLADSKVLFGPHKRLAIAPIHTRFDAVEWVVWDAERPCPDTGLPEIIRQAGTAWKAVADMSLTARDTAAIVDSFSDRIDFGFWPGLEG